MARRRHRRVKSNHSGKVRRKRRHRRMNPLGRRRRRRNPGPGALGSVIPIPASAEPSAVKRAKVGGPKRKRRRLSKAQRRVRKSLRSRAKRIRAAARKMPKSAGRSMRLAQSHRMFALAKAAPRKPGKTQLAKALHLKTNPGIGGLVVAAKAIAPQAVAGALGLGVCAVIGQQVAAKIVIDTASGAPVIRKSFQDATDPTKPSKMARLMPAGITAVAAGGMYLLADKFAPKYKGAVAIGGLIGAALQVVSVFAAESTDPNSIIGKVSKALTLGDYTAVGGLGGRSYAEGGMFRDIGDYTAVGAADPRTLRPRPSADNQTQWAMNGLGAVDPRTLRPRPSADNRTQWAMNGVDDSTEWAAGEGGVLGGGMFRGQSG